MSAEFEKAVGSRWPQLSGDERRALAAAIVLRVGDAIASGENVASVKAVIDGEVQIKGIDLEQIAEEVRGQ